MKKATLIITSMAMLTAFAAMLLMEACSITGKGWEAELGPISIKVAEIEADFGKSVIIKLIEEVKEDEPEKYHEAIKKICHNVELYEKVAENYRKLIDAMQGVPNTQSMIEGFEALAKSYEDRVKAFREILAEYDVDCEEVMN